MNYLGWFHSHNLPNNNLPRLIEYIDGVEVLTSYNAENPFYIEQIAVLLDATETYSVYDVFECGEFFNTDIEAKAFSISFAENLIRYRRAFANYHNNRIRNN